MESWTSLNISDEVLKAIADMGCIFFYQNFLLHLNMLVFILLQW